MRARAGTYVVAVALVASTVWLTAPTSPAGATTVASSGTTVTATISGDTGYIAISCVDGRVRVHFVAATPPLACGTVTQVTLIGTAGADRFAGVPDPTAFGALTTVRVDAGAGDDSIQGTVFRDAITTGTGYSWVHLPAAGLVADTLDHASQLHIHGTSVAETMTASTISGSTRVRVQPGVWLVTAPVSSLFLYGAAGDDVLDASAVAGASLYTSLHGEAGDDTLTSGQARARLEGGPGSATYTLGSYGGQQVYSTSPRDVIRPTGLWSTTYDSGGPLGGRRFETGATGHHEWIARLDGDAYLHIRPIGTDRARVTAAGARFGAQDLGPAFEEIGVGVTPSGRAPDRVVVDTAPLTGQAQTIEGGPGVAVEVVVPNGSWSQANGVVTFTGGYQPITVTGTGSSIRVRPPYGDLLLRFANRVIRDTQSRHSTATERNALRAALAAGRTRAQAVQDLTSTDVYRGLVADRAVVDILRRANDPGGRDYWVGQLRSGLVTRRLRANLYGSPEYFTQRSSSDVETFVVNAYRDILDRSPSTADIAYWAGQIASGTPRGTVADRFLNTPEARALLVGELYTRWLLREPTSAEVSTWSPRLASSSTDGELALTRALAASDSYWSRPDA